MSCYSLFLHLMIALDLSLHHPERCCTMCRWYVLIDDDTIMLVDNLLTVMADYDPSTPVNLVGYRSMLCRPLGAG